MRENLELGLMQLFRSDSTMQKRLRELEEQVLAGQIAAGVAVRDLLAFFASKAGSGS